MSTEPIDGTPISAIVGRADEIYRDYSLPTVRAWKARTGGLAVGFMPIYIPCEILDAQGVLPVARRYRNPHSRLSSRVNGR